jgi:hypothetical protein
MYYDQLTQSTPRSACCMQSCIVSASVSGVRDSGAKIAFEVPSVEVGIRYVEGDFRFWPARDMPDNAANTGGLAISSIASLRFLLVALCIKRRHGEVRSGRAIQGIRADPSETYQVEGRRCRRPNKFWVIGGPSLDVLRLADSWST